MLSTGLHLTPDPPISCGMVIAIVRGMSSCPIIPPDGRAVGLVSVSAEGRRDGGPNPMLAEHDALRMTHACVLELADRDRRRALGQQRIGWRGLVEAAEEIPLPNKRRGHSYVVQCGRRVARR